MKKIYKLLLGKNSASHILTLVIFIILNIIIILPLYKNITSTPKGDFNPLIHGPFPHDYYSYLSFIRQGRNQLFQINPYSVEPSSTSRSHMYYLLLGKLTKYIRMSEIQAYYFGIYSSFIIEFIYSILLINSLFIVPNRYLAYGLIFLSGPWLKSSFSIFGINISPGLDWWVTSDPYGRITLLPHRYFGIALMIGAYYHLSKFLRRRKKRDFIMSFLYILFGTYLYIIPGALFTAVILIITCLLLACSFLNHKFHRLKFYIMTFMTIIFAGLFSIIIIYVQLKNTQFPWNQILTENIWFPRTSLPAHLVNYLSSYGILFFFIPLGVLFSFRKIRFEFVFASLMVILSVLLYIPAIYNLIPIAAFRLLDYGQYFFGGILSAYGIFWIYRIVKSLQFKKKFLLFVVSLLFINSLLTLKEYWLPKLTSSKVKYISKNHADAMSYLSKMTPFHSFILTTQWSGEFIPSFTDNIVYIGHWLLASNIEERIRLSDSFFSGWMSTENAKEFLMKNKFNYVYWEKTPYPTFPQHYSSLITPVYNNDSVTIYKVY